MTFTTVTPTIPKGAEDIIYRVGFSGPTILQWVNIVFILNNPKYIIFYIFFVFFVMGWINKLLKHNIKENRPVGYNIIDTNYDKKKYYEGEEKHGMPSGHAQLNAFITVFVWFITKNMYLLYFNLIISLITLFQRWKFKRHSISQLVAGTAVGGSLGWGIYNVLQNEFLGSSVKISM